MLADTGVALLFRDRVRPARATHISWYWSDNLHHVVRSPRRSRPRWKTASGSSRWPRTPYSRRLPPALTVAALAAMRREQALHGLRGFLAELFGGGAAIDFSVIFPGGDALHLEPPPAAAADSVHPLMGARVRLVRTVGRGRRRGATWLGDHRITLL